MLRHHFLRPSYRESPHFLKPSTKREGCHLFAPRATVHRVARSQTGLSDFTFTFHFSLSCTGEGNGNPLQCSCLENPRDRGAWWAAVYGVAQSRTRLKRLSSSSRLVEGSMLFLETINVYRIGLPLVLPSNCAWRFLRALTRCLTARGQC